MKMSRIGLCLGFLAVWPATGALAQPAGEPRDLPIIGAPIPGRRELPAGGDRGRRTTCTGCRTACTGSWRVIVLFVTALLLDRDLPLQQPAQPDPGELHPQHAARDRLDADPGGDPDRDRLVLAADPVQAARGPDARPDGQGDRQPVVLELRLSGERRHLRQPDAAAQDDLAALRLHRRRATCSPPTPRWWCRWTRWCTCW